MAFVQSPNSTSKIPMCCMLTVRIPGGLSAGRVQIPGCSAATPTGAVSPLSLEVPTLPDRRLSLSCPFLSISLPLESRGLSRISLQPYHDLVRSFPALRCSFLNICHIKKSSLSVPHSPQLMTKMHHKPQQLTINLMYFDFFALDIMHLQISKENWCTSGAFRKIFTSVTNCQSRKIMRNGFVVWRFYVPWLVVAECTISVPMALLLRGKTKKERLAT